MIVLKKVFRGVEQIFTEAPVRLFNSGHMCRDFTYVDDVIESVARLIKAPPLVTRATPDGQQPPHRLYNVGNGQPVEIIEVVNVLEKVIGKRAERELLPIRSVDVLETFSDSSELERVIGFAPHTTIETGLRSFVKWFRDSWYRT